MSWLLTEEERTLAIAALYKSGQTPFLRMEHHEKALIQAQLRKVAERLKAGTNSLNFIPFISQKDLQALYKEAGVGG